MNSGVRRHIKKTTRDQFEMLIRELKRHPEILKRTAYFGTNKVKADQVWETIAQKLNSIGPPLRMAFEWKKIWADLKSRRKKSIYNGNSSNVNNSVGSTDENDCLGRENLFDAEDSSDKILLDLLAPALSPQSIIDYEIEEIELQPTTSIKMELHEDPIENTEESNAMEAPMVRGTVFGMGEYQLEHPPTNIKTESPSNIIESSDESEAFNTREPSPPPPLPQKPQLQLQQPPLRLPSSKAIKYSIKTRPTQLKNRPSQNAESSSTNLLRQQLKNQTHLLEALTNSIISLTDRQAAAAERQALATERQAAATERQAAAMEAVLEHFRARQHADQTRKNINRNQ